jgi:phosphatidylethanolamine/phosphatidyl-N-methylethanolamine N-methyltransferase
MALFERDRSPEPDEILGADAATGALSVTAVENDFVARVYQNISSVYDWTFGPTLHQGRVQALRRMAIKTGERVLEVGVGTGINASLYPRDCSVTGIDLTGSMLDKARDRIAREGIDNVRLLEMDAADLKFADNTFDVVYAPYLISVVPDPVTVAREMHRVCRPGGRVIILNHFRSTRNPLLAWIERAISPYTVHIGFKSDLDLPGFLAQAELKPVAIERVNFPKIWSLVICTKA